ncbi:hypothetical protein YC2023_049793 [Brassica napus]
MSNPRSKIFSCGRCQAAPRNLGPANSHEPCIKAVKFNILRSCALLEMIKLYQVPIVFDHDPSSVFDFKNNINGR